MSKTYDISGGGGGGGCYSMQPNERSGGFETFVTISLQKMSKDNYKHCVSWMIRMRHFVNDDTRLGLIKCLCWNSNC